MVVKVPQRGSIHLRLLSSELMLDEENHRQFFSLQYFSNHKSSMKMNG